MDDKLIPSLSNKIKKNSNVYIPRHKIKSAVDPIRDIERSVIDTVPQDADKAGDIEGLVSRSIGPRKKKITDTRAQLRAKVNKSAVSMSSITDRINRAITETPMMKSHTFKSRKNDIDEAGVDSEQTSDKKILKDVRALLYNLNVNQEKSNTDNQANATRRDISFEMEHERTATLRNIDNFNSHTSTKYMEQSLALQYRQTLLMKDLLAISKAGYGVLENKLEAIKINTAVSEMRKRSLVDLSREQVFRSIINRTTTHLLDKVEERIASRVGDKVSEYVGRAYNSKTGQSIRKKATDTAQSARDYVKSTIENEDEDEDVVVDDDVNSPKAADKIRRRIRKTVKAVTPTQKRRDQAKQYLKDKEEQLRKKVEEFDLQKTKEDIEKRIRDFDAKKLKESIRRKSTQFTTDVTKYKDDFLEEHDIPGSIATKVDSIKEATRKRTSSMNEQLYKILDRKKPAATRKYGDGYDRHKEDAKSFFGEYIQDYYKELGLEDDEVIDENKPSVMSRIRDKLKESKLSKADIEQRIKDINISNLVDEKKAAFKRSSVYKKYQTSGASGQLDKLRARYKDFNLDKFSDDMKKKGSDLLEDAEFYKDDMLFKAQNKWKDSSTKKFVDKKIADMKDPAEREKFLASLNEKKDKTTDFLKENFSMDSLKERRDRFKSLFGKKDADGEDPSGILPFKKSIGSQKLDQILKIMQTTVPVHFSQYHAQMNGIQTPVSATAANDDFMNNVREKPRAIFNKYINKFATAVNDNVINPIRDVYRKNAIKFGMPLLSARQIKEGVIFSDGTPVKNADNINLPVIDPKTGNALITMEDLQSGLVDAENRPVGKSIIASIKGIGKSVARIYKQKWLDPLGEGIKRVGKTAYDKLMPEKVKNALGPEGFAINNLRDILAEKLDKINESLKEKKKAGDTDGDGIREGSYQDRVKNLITGSAGKPKQDPEVKQGGKSAVASMAAIAGLLSGPKSSAPQEDAKFDEDDKDGGGEGGIMSTLIGTYLASKIPGFKFLKKGKDKLAGLFKKGGKAAASAAGAAMGGAGAKAAASSGGKLAMSLAAPVVASSAGKFALKSAIKKIPLVGALAGTAFSLERLWEGDLVGAGLEFLSGIVSIVPFAGTAASIMIDSVLGLRDYNKMEANSPVKKYIKTRMDFLGVDNEKEYGTVLQIEDKIHKIAFEKGSKFEKKDFQTYMLDFGLDPSDDKQVGYFTGWVTTKVARSLMAHAKSLADAGIKYEDAKAMTDEQAVDVQKSYLSKMAPHIATYKKLRPYKSDYDKFEQDYADKQDTKKKGDYRPPQEKDLTQPKDDKKSVAGAIAAGVDRASNNQRTLIANASNDNKSMNISSSRGNNVVGFPSTPEARDAARAKYQYIKGTPGADYTKGFENITVDDDVSSLSAKEESGSSGSYAIGFDSKGGTSYGQYQIAARTGTFSKFLGWLDAQGGKASEIAQRLRNAGNADGGKTGAVAQEWRALAREGLLTEYEHKFIQDSHYKPAFSKLRPEIQELVKNSKVLQKVLFSTAVQHGPGENQGAPQIFNKVYSPEMDVPAFIRAIYKERGTRFNSSSSDVQASVLNRFGRESRTALAMHTKELQQTESTMTASNDNNQGGGDVPAAGNGGEGGSGSPQGQVTQVASAGTTASPEAASTPQKTSSNPIAAKAQETQDAATTAAATAEIKKEVPSAVRLATEQKEEAPAVQPATIASVDPAMVKELSGINKNLTTLVGTLDTNMASVVKLGQTNNSTVVAPVVAQNNTTKGSSDDDASISMKKNGSNRYAT